MGPHWVFKAASSTSDHEAETGLEAGNESHETESDDRECDDSISTLSLGFSRCVRSPSSFSSFVGPIRSDAPDARQAQHWAKPNVGKVSKALGAVLPSASQASCFTVTLAQKARQQIQNATRDGSTLSLSTSRCKRLRSLLSPCVFVGTLVFQGESSMFR